MKKIEAILLNLLNGNLTDAQRMAKPYGFWTLLCGIESLGYSTSTAANMTAYLKGRITYGEYASGGK